MVRAKEITAVGLMLMMTVIGCRSDTYRGGYAEAHRPQFHFSPERGWMNDPNGLVYYAGEYHLFYQYLPDTIEHRGPKHWGHAISADLVHWQHLPIALYPDHGGGVWSGSVVVDWNNTSGFRSGAERVMVAVFTQADGEKQQQGIAYSNDRGRSWTMYPGNPVIANPGIRDFRDPKVFWHGESDRWVMVLAAGDRVMVYASRDLKEWTLGSEFGALEGSHGGVWECPDLFELAVDGDAQDKRWVMLVSVGSGGSPSGGSGGVQYFVGDFDGRTFTNHHPAEATHWLDHGRDDYAGITFSDVPEQDGRRIFLGWMGNWWYAPDVPTTPWRGAMTVPRALALTADRSGEVRLVSSPVVELRTLRGRSFRIVDTSVSDSTGWPAIDGIAGGAFEVAVEWELGTASEFGLIVSNGDGDQTVVGYNVAARKVFVDRRRSGVTDFNPCFARPIDSATLMPESNAVKFHVLVDWSSIEVFANDGSVVITDLIFPQGGNDALELYARDGDVRLTRCEVWELESIWR
jgi:fructan beta-fructosidase